MKLFLYRYLVVFISSILFCIPFFWFAPGEMDLGGDSSRLYFYSPIQYLYNYALSGISPSNLGVENIGYYSIPFVSLLALLQKIWISPTATIEMFHGLTLSLSFVFMYLVVKELLSHGYSSKISYVYVASIFSGLLYIFSPISVFGWDKVLITHYKLFLNPLMFFLLLKYFSLNRFSYLIIALLVSFVFSANFSFASAPSFIAFYSTSFVYLLFYTKFVLQKPIFWVRMIMAFSLFIFIQFFHLLPQLISLVTPESQLFNTVFLDSGKFDRGLNYFNGILGAIKVSQNILLLPQFGRGHFIYYAFIFLPLSLLYAGVAYAKKPRDERRFFALTLGIFLITLFFVSASITSLGVTLYRSLFIIPGFSMFRNFYGQWAGVLLFYFVLLFGISMIEIIQLLTKRVIVVMISGFVILLVFTAWPLISGTSVNPRLWQSKELGIVTKLDPEFERALYALSKLPHDGKVLTLPLTDPGYQMVAGVNSGAYQGPSMIAYVSGKQDFSGYEEFGKYKGMLVQYMNTKDYESLKKLFGILNIRYIFWNSDSRIYDDFLNFPYDFVRRFMPKDQKGYGELLHVLGAFEVASFGHIYKIYEFPGQYVKPEVYISQNVKRIEKTGNDISLPLSILETGGNNSLIVQGGRSTFDKSTDPFTKKVDILKPYSVVSRMRKNTEPPTYLHHAFAKYSPRSFLYPLVLLKEGLALSRIQDSIDSGIDYRLFLSAKRVYELEKYAKDLSLTYDVGSLEELRSRYKKLPTVHDKKGLWASMFDSFDSWEIILSWYESFMREAIELTHTYALESDDYRYYEYMIHAYLNQHEERMDTLIRNSFPSPGDTEYVKRISGEMFASLHQMLSGRFLDTYVVSYDVSSVSHNDHLKTVKLRVSDMGALQPSDILVEVVGDTKYSFHLSDDGKWYEASIGTIKNRKDVRLVLNPSTSVLEQQTIAVVEKKMTDKQNALEVRSDFVSGNHGLLWEVSSWLPKQHYYLSFQYKTEGKGYDVKIVEKDSKQVTNRDTLLSREYIKSSDWLTYQAVVYSHTNTDSGYIQFAPTASEDVVSRIELKNFSLVALPVPELVVEDAKDSTKGSPVMPTMTYEKISPTKYLVHVSHAGEPYYIALNQQFNSRWRIANETNKKVSLGNHVAANTYANAWFVTPKDVNEQKEYTLVIEFGMQKYFSIGMVISIITVLFLCILLGRLVWKAKRV